MKPSALIQTIAIPKEWMYRAVLHFPFLIRNDRKYIQYVWNHKMPYPLNLDTPCTFNQKIQWLKLNDRNPMYTMMVDKYAVKDYVAKVIGDEYIIPAIGIWDRLEDIDWDNLPEQFVLKCTHDSGGLVLCRDKSKLDKGAAIKKLRRSLKRNYYMTGREWPYKDVPRRILAEKYMEDEYGELRDYKLFCFNGKVKLLFIATDRHSRPEPYFDFYDENFNHLDFRNGHPNAPLQPSKPRSFEKMKELASKLSKGIPEVRIDFYDVNGHPYFGEMTFFHNSGFVPFEPSKWDVFWGDMIDINLSNC